MVSTMEVRKGPVEEFWGNANTVSLQENTSLEGQLILGTLVLSGNPQDQPEAAGPSSEGKLVRVL